MRPADLHVRRLDGSADLLALHRRAPERYPHLLQSVVHGTPQARWDILFAFPGERLTLGGDGRLSGPGAGDDFLSALDAWFERERSVPPSGASLPFRGGWFLYLGYELAAQVEPVLTLPAAAQRLPTAFAVRHPAALLRDHGDDGLWAVAESPQLLEALVTEAEGALPAPMRRPRVTAVEEEPGERYLAGVERIQRYIRDGDVFQVNLSRGWRARLAEALEPAEVYAALCAANPAPFAGLVCTGEGSAVISSSPERLLQVRGGRASTRPIAGTRPRGADAAADRALSAELHGHPKERAEHVMLIDLERNDLGRVCRPGSVRVDELMAIESYTHVHHIVSNVIGALRPEVLPGQAIRAVFPGGTITGCPKVRCMEIIAELEKAGRGPYTGSMGYLNLDGDLDLNILIRTLLLEDGVVSLRAGAGIVADSVPAAELEETRAKARGLLRALGLEGGA